MCRPQASGPLPSTCACPGGRRRFYPAGSFRGLPPIPAAALAEALRHRVLAFLCAKAGFDLKLAARMRKWQHSGCSIHNPIRVKANDAEGRQQLARYLIRSLFALEQMTYDSTTRMGEPEQEIHPVDEFPGERPHSGHAGRGLSKLMTSRQGWQVRDHPRACPLKRNFQRLPAAQWLTRLLAHIPDKYAALVRYYGHYSNRARRQRRAAANADATTLPLDKTPRDPRQLGPAQPQGL